MSQTAYERRVARLKAYVLAQEAAEQVAKEQQKSTISERDGMAMTGEIGQDTLPPLEEALAEGDPSAPVDLERLTVKELEQIAKEHGIEGYSRMKKAELIAALEGGGVDAGEAETTN